MKISNVLHHNRSHLVAAIVVLAALGRCRQPAPPPSTLAGVAELFGAAAHCTVGQRDFLWEPSRGTLTDTAFGRRALFLGSVAPGAPKDLYRAVVRVTPEGHPISVERAVNLTSSPLGDVQELVGRDHYAAYVVVAYGTVQQVTLLDLDGEFGGDDPSSWLDRAMDHLTNLQESGSCNGLGRTEIRLSQPSSGARLSLTTTSLMVVPDAREDGFAVDLSTGEVVPGPAADRAGATATRIPHLPKPPIIWAVDTVRAWTGPEPVAWLEEKVFAVRDWVRRTTYFGLGGKEPEAASLAAEPTAAVAVTPSRPIVSDGMLEDTTWPPAPLRSIWKNPEPEEGRWEPVRYPFLKKVRFPGSKQEAPPYFYKTYVRSDPRRPYSQVLLVAMDARQLQLGIEGGIEDPKSLTGARGEGRIPRDPAILSRVVGAFNGAFKTTHGQYGMMVGRKVLLPPKPGSATVAVVGDGRAAFGTWPESDTIPSDVVSFRQNLEPLVEGARVNPSGRTQWGYQLPGTSMLTHRSGLCLTSGGHMIYAWGAEVSGVTLGNAMLQAGCIYALHLDMNPHHTAFAFLDIRDVGRRDFDAKILTPEMEVLPERFIIWSPKDFFYLTLRRFQPSAVPELELEVDEGKQPQPVWAPAFFRGTIQEATVPVHLVGIAASRVRYVVRAGTQGTADEREHEELPTALEREDARLVLGAVGLGNSSKTTPLGIRVGGVVGVSFGRGAILAVSQQEGLRVLGPDSDPNGVGGADAVELPLLCAGRKPIPAATERKMMRKRGAICVSSEGFAWIAQATASADEPLVAALMRVGCDTVASLDRGTHDVSFIDRAGTQHPPLERYEQPTLYILAAPMPSGAFLWPPDSPPVSP